LTLAAAQAQRVVDVPELTGKSAKPRKEPSEVLKTFVAEIGKAENKTPKLLPIVSSFLEFHPPSVLCIVFVF
jgi:hypothetical protein